MADIVCCASCGVAAIDDVKLMLCDSGCDLVKYCSDNCQENNREQHEEECKKRKEELRDKQLFEQPDCSFLGECPICCLPLSIDPSKSTMMPCCCKIICNGCHFLNTKREIEAGLEHRCAFCRGPVPKSDDEHEKRLMERVKKHNDPAAMTLMGKKHQQKGDYGKTVEYWTKAAELGDVGAHYFLGCLYYKGLCVEKDEKKAIDHYEQAAIGGHSEARGLLAMNEKNSGRLERAARHFMINANLGCNASLKFVKDLFIQGVVSKEEYAAALRGFQAAVNETKSTEREKAEEAIRLFEAARRS